MIYNIKIGTEYLPDIRRSLRIYMFPSGLNIAFAKNDTKFKDGFYTVENHKWVHHSDL